MNPLGSGTRLGTMIVDHICMTMIVVIIASPGMVYDILQTLHDPEAPPKLFLGNYYMNILAFSLYFCKDIYQGRSIAKHAFKLQLADARTGMPAKFNQVFPSKYYSSAWPIEVIVALINNERRIGDFIAGTKLVPFESEKHHAQVNWSVLIFTVLLSVVFTYLAMFYPMELIFKNVMAF